MARITLCTALAAFACSGAAVAAERPNVVFFLVDDMGWTDLGCYGSTLYETPNVDRLAAEGIRFTDAYAACPVCSPTRHSIMSGKYPARSGCTNFGQHMDPTEVTLAEALRAGGYATYFLGKWHLGGSREMLPESQGFDVNVGGGANGQPSTYFYPYKSAKGGGRNDVRGLDTGGSPGEYLTDRLGDEAVKLLKKHQSGKPFFLYLAFYSVHTPIMAKPELEEKYKRKVSKTVFSGPRYRAEGRRKMKQHQDSPEFAAMVQSVDENVGKVMRTVEELGFAENTIVFFTSDNGGASYYSNATCNLPLRAAKGWLYEGGIREPLIVHWPGRIKPGTCRAPVLSTDFYPTILDLVRLPRRPLQHVDGISFEPLLMGGDAPASRTIYWHYPHNHGSGSRAAAAVRSGRYKLIEFLAAGKPSELYDLCTDIGESRDLAGTYPEIARKLQADLDAWQKRVNAKPYVIRARKK